MTVWKITYRANSVQLAGDTRSVEADYFKRDDGWFSFKTSDHKVVFDVCAEDVRSVEVDPTYHSIPWLVDLGTTKVLITAHYVEGRNLKTDPHAVFTINGNVVATINEPRSVRQASADDIREFTRTEKPAN